MRGNELPWGMVLLKVVSPLTNFAPLKCYGFDAIFEFFACVCIYGAAGLFATNDSEM